MTRIIQTRMVSTAMARKLKVRAKVKAKGNDDELSDLGVEFGSWTDSTSKSIYFSTKRYVIIFKESSHNPSHAEGSRISGMVTTMNIY
jgi:hypothetical protein